jgi:hypothetical protein
MLTTFSPNTFANDGSSSNKMFMTAPCIFFFWLINVNVKPPKARIAVLILTSGDILRSKGRRLGVPRDRPRSCYIPCANFLHSLSDHFQARLGLAMSDQSDNPACLGHQSKLGNWRLILDT